MSSKFKHLNLALQRDGRKKTNPKQKIQSPLIVRQNKANRIGHSGSLYNKATKQLEIWDMDSKGRREENLPQLPLDKALLIKISPEEFNLDFFRSTFGMEVVCEYDDGIVIVASDPAAFEKAIDKIQEFAENIKGSGNVARLCDIIVEETKEERLRRILSDEVYSLWQSMISKLDVSVVVDVSIECLGTIHLPDKPKKDKEQTEERFQKKLLKWEEKRNHAYMQWDELFDERYDNIQHFIGSYNGQIIQCAHDPNGNLDSFDMKLSISVKCLKDFAENYPYVFEISYPEEFDINDLRATLDGTSNLPFEIISPESDSPTVCVIDSGIQEGHVYLSQAIRSDISYSFLNDNKVVDEVNDGGHGTRVAGAILYPQGISNQSDKYSLPCYIANARVLNDLNGMPDDLLPSKVLNDIFEKYHKVENIRIFNHSINSKYPFRKKYMSSWATTIDNVCFDNDLLFIQSAGNLRVDSENSFSLGISQHLIMGRGYPDYLSENSCGIANPAQSMQALTVGSICCGNYEDEDLKSFGSENAVSSFSRSGYGMWNSIKPEVVEYGGDYIRSKNNNTTFTTKADTCPELIRRSPEGPAYAKDAIGTSFAAPKVAYIATQLQKMFPNQPSLLYKALIVQSARWTSWAESISAYSALKYIGYGVPSLDRASVNDVHRVTYITDGEKSVTGGSIHIYKVRIPDGIKNLGNQIRIDVTLTFAAKPRRTRKGFKGYFSTWAEWKSSRFDENVDSFADRILEADDEYEVLNDASNGKGFKWTIGAQDNHGSVKQINRNRSTTQKDWTVVSAYELPEEFCIAVQGHNGWSKSNEHYAKYSLAISFEAINRDLEIYNLFEIQTEAEVEAEQEIEAEIEIDALQ